MSLETELRDHLRRAAAEMTVREPDYAGVVSRGRWRRAIRYLATAAVASMVVVVAVVLAPSVGSERAEQTTSPTPTIQPAKLDEQYGELVPGPYVITSVPPFNITITVPDGWERLLVPAVIWAAPNNATNLGFGTPDNLYADPCAIDLGMLDPPPGPSVDDLVAAYAALPGMEATVPQEVTVDGYDAKYIELTGPEGRDECVDGEAFIGPAPNGESVPAPGADARDRLWIVDVAGNRLVISSNLRDYASPEQNAELEQIIESIQIELP